MQSPLPYAAALTKSRGRSPRWGEGTPALLGRWRSPSWGLVVTSWALGPHGDCTPVLLLLAVVMATLAAAAAAAQGLCGSKSSHHAGRRPG